MNHIEAFWNAFLASVKDNTLTYQSVYHFELSEYWANVLLELVLIGQKKATCSSLASFQIEHEKIPEIGDLNIVTDWNHIPYCVVKTTNVTILPFQEVDYALCSKEGEDENLASWQKGHRRFFEEEGTLMGYPFDESMMVVFEEFEVVYQIKQS